MGAKLLGNKNTEKPIENTSDINESDNKKVTKTIKKIIAVIGAVLWKPMLIIIIVFSIISLLTNFLRTIFVIAEAEVNGPINASVSLQYKEELRRY